MKFQSVQPELAYLALLVVGAFEFQLGPIAYHQAPSPGFRCPERGGRSPDARAVPSTIRNNVAILWLVGGGGFPGSWDHRERSRFSPSWSPDRLVVGLHLVGMNSATPQLASRE